MFADARETVHATTRDPHDEHEHDVHDLARRFWVAAVFSAPVFAIAMSHGRVAALEVNKARQA